MTLVIGSSLQIALACDSQATTEAPKIELYLVQYDGVNCLKRAEYSLKESGFTLSSGTYKAEDRVGIHGNYKGAVTCSSEAPTAVVFTVAGNEYSKARELARKLQYNFMNY